MRVVYDHIKCVSLWQGIIGIFCYSLIIAALKTRWNNLFEITKNEYVINYS